MKFYAIGGVPRVFGELRREGTVLERGQVAVVDLSKSQPYEVLLDYKSDEYAAQPGFRSGSMAKNGDLILVTGNEVIRFCTKKRIITKKISCKHFNDLHHAVEFENHYYVVSTGFDAVLKLDENGNVIQIFNASFVDPFSRHQKDTDLRLFDSLKPHDSHVNHVQILGDSIWATRFNCKDCIDLVNKDNIISLPGEGCHDGIYLHGKHYFTSVDGRMKIYSQENGSLESVDLYGDDREKSAPMGWCRAIAADSENAYIGFTQLRSTKISANLRWMRNMVRSGRIEKKPLPTSILTYNFQKKEVVDFYKFPENGIGALFSIITVKNDENN